MSMFKGQLRDTQGSGRDRVKKLATILAAAPTHSSSDSLQDLKCNHCYEVLRPGIRLEEIQSRNFKHTAQDSEAGRGDRGKTTADLRPFKCIKRINVRSLCEEKAYMIESCFRKYLLSEDAPMW